MSVEKDVIRMDTNPFSEFFYESEKRLMKSFEKRVSQLRNYEIYCYRICYYVLDTEQLAIEATKKTLIHLFHDGDFLLANKLQQRLYVKQVSMKYALHAFAASEHKSIL